MAQQRIVELKEQLDRLLDDADLEDLTGDERFVVNEAVGNFKLSGSGLLAEASEPMWAYYRGFVSEFSADERLEYGLPDLAETAEIWDEVSFRHPPEVAVGGGRLEPARSYISFEGEVSWEREHGLQLVFEHGLRVCKVGPYDGHFTNAHAYADESLLGVVFREYPGTPGNDKGSQHASPGTRTKRRWFRRR